MLLAVCLCPRQGLEPRRAQWKTKGDSVPMPFTRETGTGVHGKLARLSRGQRDLRSPQDGRRPVGPRSVSRAPS